MTTTHVPRSATDIPIGTPLSGPQRAQLRELLDEQWRETVALLTTLALEVHAAPHDSGADPQVVTRLAGVRRRLVDIEAAMARLSTRSYGLCDSCDRRVPFEQLEAHPQVRYCTACLSH